jgi:hypothetical protein
MAVRAPKGAENQFKLVSKLMVSIDFVRLSFICEYSIDFVHAYIYDSLSIFDTLYSKIVSWLMFVNDLLISDDLSNET